MPERVQQKRTKGWRKPENAVSVARPTSWGNPFYVGDTIYTQTPVRVRGQIDPGLEHFREFVVTPALAVELYRQAISPSADEIRTELRGKNLMCFCPLDQPCHADVLLEIANA